MWNKFNISREIKSKWTVSETNNEASGKKTTVGKDNFPSDNTSLISGSSHVVGILTRLAVSQDPLSFLF